MESYSYEGLCPSTGQRLTLPRTPAAEAAARELMQRLGPLDEGKMFGVLLVEGSRVLYAFSGHEEREGWVPPIRPIRLADEKLAELDRLKAELQALPIPEANQELERALEVEAALKACHRLARQHRDQRRRQHEDEEVLRQESRAHGRERRQLKARLEPLKARLRALEERRVALVRQRRALSRSMQSELHRSFEASLWPGQPWSLASLFAGNPPAGTGECCAPKLLHEASRQGWEPLGLAEFWWGPGSREHGQFSAACADRCQPLLGALLSRARLSILFEDDALLAVDKPPGVLSLPGRGELQQDSLLTRLQRERPGLFPVHRLDLETSGVLLFAKCQATQAELHRQFRQRLVEKVYLAELESRPTEPRGTCDLALTRDSERPGCSKPDPEGKPARTHFRCLEGTRVELRPVTGRSHQLRIHAAYGLHIPIRGDRLYGAAKLGERLHLHACHLTVRHRGQILRLESAPPF